MFERVAQTEAYKDAEAREGRSVDQIAALRLAATVLVVNVALTLAIAILFQRPLPLTPMGISLGLAYYLYRLRPRAEALALGLTIVSAIVQTFLLALTLRTPDPAAAFLPAFLELLPGFGLVAALLLLLTGDSGRRRRVTAIVLFALFTVGISALVIVGRILEPG